MDPQDLLRQRLMGMGLLGGQGIMGSTSGLGLGPTPGTRIGTMGMYMPAPTTTTGVNMPVSQGAWGVPIAEQSSRPVGAPGLGEASGAPTMNPAGTGEAAWRTPVGTIIQAPEGPGMMEQQNRGDVLGSPVEAPTTPASIGSQTPPAGIMSAGRSAYSAPKTTQAVSAPTPVVPATPTPAATPAPAATTPQTTPTAAAPAPAAPTPRPTPVTVGRGENQYTAYAPQGVMGAISNILPGFGRRRGILDSIIGSLFGGWDREDTRSPVQRANSLASRWRGSYGHYK